MSDQKYSTPDGSIWVDTTDPVTGRVDFDRIGSPDGSHEMDFRPQKLNEVLRSWGPLSLYDPDHEELVRIKAALLGLPWHCDVAVFGKRLQDEFHRMGLHVTPIGGDDE